MVNETAYTEVRVSGRIENWEHPCQSLTVVPIPGVPPNLMHAEPLFAEYRGIIVVRITPSGGVNQE